MGEFVFDDGQYSFTAAKKSLFSRILETKQFFALKIANHMTYNLHHRKSVIKMDFLSQGLGYHHIQTMRLEFLQRFGHQIWVNTWRAHTH